MSTGSGELVVGVLYHYSEQYQTPKVGKCYRAAYGTPNAISSPLASYTSAAHAVVNLN